MSPAVKRPRSRSRSPTRVDHRDAESHLVQSSSSSSSSSWSKVCIVCDGGNWNYSIFIVDLTKNDNSNVDPLIPKDPTLLIDYECFYEAVFCVIGSTLYAFENVEPGEINRRGVFDGAASKLVFTYDLPSDDVFNLRLKRSMLQKAPPTHHRKFCPIATPTPDGKHILLFSSLVSFLSPEDDDDDDRHDFELYDLVSKSWYNLPNVNCPDKRHLIGLSYMRVNAFDFIGSYVLVLQTNIGFFTLDFIHGDSWTHSDTSDGILSYIPNAVGRLVMIGSEICLTPQHAYDINPCHDNGDERLFDYPNMMLLTGSVYSDLCARITPLGYDAGAGAGAGAGGVYNFCILQMGIKKDTCKQAVLSLQVYSLDLTKCTNGLFGYDVDQNEPRPLPGATKVKSFNFCYEDPQTFLAFSIMALSYIPPPLDTV